MDLIKVTCEEGRQEGRSIYRVPVITFRDKRRLFRGWPSLRAPDKAWDEWFAEVATFLPKWDFIGTDGEVLPDPEDQPDVFNQLTDEELTWVITEGLFGVKKASSAK